MRVREIELVGLPGAGKTTLADAVIAELRRSGQPTLGRDEERRRVGEVHASRSRLVRWLDYVRHHAREPAPALRAASLALALRPFDARGLRRAFHLSRLTHNHELGRSRLGADAVVLYDQGLIQEIWAVLYLRECDRICLLEALVDALRPRLPDAVVHVRVDGRTAASRMAERRARVGPLGEIDRMDDLPTAVLDRSERQLETLCRLLGERGVRRLEVDGRSPHERQVEQTVAFLGDEGIVPRVPAPRMENEDVRED